MRQVLIPTRRFGRTGIQIPVLSLGGMRFQQSWKDIDSSEITFESQQNLDILSDQAFVSGCTHFETARHYGSSERQLGWTLKNMDLSSLILQTKVPPLECSYAFEAELETSFERLGCKRLDLLAIHGINLPEHLHHTLRPGGCMDVVRRWQSNGRIGHVGFSTHAPTDLIVKAIASNQFDYVNLHWYFINQDNEPALDAAQKYDLGVFIISPTDKGGHLHTPSKQLVELCKPLHPIVFNDLFCLNDSRVHTISVGASCKEDLGLHLDAINCIEMADDFLFDIKERLNKEAISLLGESWWKTWKNGLPSWKETPGGINVPVLLWLYNLLEAWGMEGYAKARYGLLGKASHWFPGSNADSLDDDVSELELKEALVSSPWADEIPSRLRCLKERIGGQINERMSSV